MTTVNPRLKVLPLRKHAIVSLHHRTRISPLETITLELTNKIVENKAIGTLSPIFRQHSDKQQIDNGRLMPLEDLQQMPPSEGEQSSVVGLLKCL